MEIVAAVQWEGSYYARWTDYRVRGGPRSGAADAEAVGKTLVTPFISPAPWAQPAADAPAPEVRLPGVVLRAEPVYTYRVGERHPCRPTVTDCSGEKFLRPTGSTALGPHSYHFSGEITARDHYHLRKRAWDGSRCELSRVDYVVDCGVPLCFQSEFSVPVSPGRKCIQDALEERAWVTGLARLVEGYTLGLHQPVAGVVRGMLALSLDPAEPEFGTVYDLPFGSHLKLDPMLFPDAVLFMRLEVTESGTLAYKPIPARLPEYPVPSIAEG